MRFDDVLGTVRTIDLTTASAAQAAWRQIVDLVGRGRAPADDWALSTLGAIRDRVPVTARAASARALYGAPVPPALVRLLATDDIAVAAPVLRFATLSDADWTDLLPALTPAGRAVLRHRRDVSEGVRRALESFGSVDFVLAGEVAPVAVEQPVADPQPAGDPAPAPAMVEDSGPFLSLGAIAKALPIVAEARRRENDNEAPVADGGVFRIADVVARIEAFQKRKDDAPRTAPAPGIATREAFRFETDPTGAIRWVDGTAREAILGTSIAVPARPAHAGVDGIAAGAFRRRARFADAHLVVGGTGPAAGRWLMTAMPLFDPASGRFTGYRGSARRPQRHEAPAPLPARAPAPAADSLRQLVHELRTPTNAIAGFSEMIECEMLGPVDPVYRDQAATMRDDAHRLLSAIDDVDVAARVAGGALPLDPEPIAVAPMLHRLAADLHLLAESRGAPVPVIADEVAVVADARALDRIVSRLLGTAIGAAAMGEEIAVHADAEAGGRVAISITRPVAFDAYPGDRILSVDDEDSPASLLGVGFSLRLVRNLTRAIGGAFDIGDRAMTLHLPAADADTMGHTASS
ncbi:MAG TPA: histidine kinase dimerization/phospho-acceptor domain-containing protein [Sphingomonas sp.]|nr:histidine kinase dimerization/phospho-acceptor domain-containing protein [Sphingomonas sp.]